MTESDAATGSSGDIRADRRFVYARESAAAGDDAAAADLLMQCIEIAPHWPPAWFALGEARERLGDKAGAEAAYRESLARDAEDVLGAALALARLGSADAPPAAPPAYVARLFDQYARRFDEHLTGTLHYRAPHLLREAVAEACAERRLPLQFGRALDLGCGTGLAGAAFRDCVACLEGIDLSTGMVAQAHSRGIYDALSVGDVVDRLRSEGEGGFDLIFAADVLVYLGNLAPLFSGVARVLASGAIFAFTAEECERGTFSVGQGARFGHSRPYIEQTAKQAGLHCQSLCSALTRQNKGEDVRGLIGVFNVTADHWPGAASMPKSAR